jgi:GntR family transcriptional regulator/MocR family aminotransferase
MSLTDAVIDLLSTTLAQADFFPRLSQQRRVYEAVRSGILLQQLNSGTKLPSSRALATGLGVARNTVIAAFEQLMAEGYVTTSIGSGTYVAPSLPHSIDLKQGKPVSSEQRGSFSGNRISSLADESDSASTQINHLSQRGQQLTQFAAGSRFEIQPFAPGDPDFSHFPFKLWQRLQNKVWREAHPDLLDYGSAGGFLPLRSAIVDYLRISRSVKVSIDQVVITSGTHQSLDLCAQLLADVGDLAWVEDPCYWAARRVFESCDLNLHPIAVDAEGIAPTASDLLTQPKLIYVTPSHQYPTGVVMSLARRRMLLDLALQKNAWILEDDYDSEFRYSGRPLASLQGLDTHGRVVYMGTFSKTLFPGIKVGYLVVPPRLTDAFKTGLYDLQRPGQMTVQAALADFINLGHFATHIRKLRQAYGAKRELLVKTLSSHLGGKVTISGEESGLHLLVEFKNDVDDVSLARLAAESGLEVRALSDYYLSSPVRRGLLIGYAYVSPEKIAYYGRQLAQVIRAGTHA